MDLRSERDVWVGDRNLEIFSIEEIMEVRGGNEFILRIGEDRRCWDIR